MYTLNYPALENKIGQDLIFGKTFESFRKKS